MAFYNTYPYTDFHELNLDWIIKTTSDMKTNVDYLMEEFAKIKVLTKEEIQAMIDASCNEVIEYSDRKNSELKADLEGQLANQYSLITNEYRSYTNNKVADLKSYVDEQDLLILQAAKDYTDDREVVIKQYVDDKFIEYLYMFNPMVGIVTDVRVVVNDIINNYLKVDALTAKEYDDLTLSAAAYDAYNISAYNYDFKGKVLLV